LGLGLPGAAPEGFTAETGAFAMGEVSSADSSVLAAP